MDGAKEKFAYLVMQQSLRQLERDRQVLRAIQQATAALQEAQQSVLADMKFHEGLSQDGDYTRLEGEGLQVPPWLSGRPPELQ